MVALRPWVEVIIGTIIDRWTGARSAVETVIEPLFLDGVLDTA
jgi:hypothetical protein